MESFIGIAERHPMLGGLFILVVASIIAGAWRVYQDRY